MKLAAADVLEALTELSACAEVQPAIDRIAGGPPILDLLTVGNIIAEAIHPGCDVGAMPLAGAYVDFGGEMAWLDAEALVLHPHLSDWARSSFSEMVALPMEAAFDMHHAFAPGVDCSLGTVAGAGFLSAQAALTFKTGAW